MDFSKKYGNIIGSQTYENDGFGGSGGGGGVTLSGSNTAAQNTTAIQSALSLGGTVDVWVPGSGDKSVDIPINDTLIIPSYTRLRLADNIKLTLAANTNKLMLKNANWQTQRNVVTSVVISNPTIGGTPAILATVTCQAAHGLTAADAIKKYVRLHGCSPAVLNSVYPLYTVVSTTVFTVILAFDAGATIANGTAIAQPFYAQPASATNTFSSTSASTNVTGVNFTTGSAWNGKGLYCVIGGNLTKVGDIASVQSATQLTLSAGATGSYSGAWIIYDAPAMYWSPADSHITIEGGIWDGNYLNQTTPDNYNKFGLYLRNIARLSIRDASMFNFAKYCIVPSGCYGGEFRNLETFSQSDNLHFLGGGNDLIVSNIFGSCGDDFVVAGHTDYPQYLDSGHVTADYGNLHWQDIRPKISFTGAVLYGTAGFSFETLSVENCGGIISGGSAILSLRNDPGSVGSQGGGAKAKIVRCQGAGEFVYNDKPFVNVNGMSINALEVDLNVGLGNTSGSSCALLINNGSKVDNLLGSINAYGAGGAINVNAAAIYTDSTSIISRANLSAVTCDGVGYGFWINTAGNADKSMSIAVANYIGNSNNYIVSSNGRVDVAINNIKHGGTVGVAQAFYFNDYSRLYVGKCPDLQTMSFGTQGRLFVAAGKNVQINAPELAVDYTTYTGGRIIATNEGNGYGAFTLSSTHAQQGEIFKKSISLAKWVWELDKTVQLP